MQINLDEKDISRKNDLRSSGNYDWSSFAKEILNNENAVHDEVKNYWSKDITISFIKKKGRGVVAISDIPTGSLLVLSKALAVQFENDASNSAGKQHSHVGIKQEILRQINSNLSLIPILSSIYDGTTETSKMLPRIVNGLPFVDIKGESTFSTERIDKIITLNSFSLRGLLKSQGREDKDYGSAFHLLPAFFNHALYPNCTYLTAGDILIMRSNQKIKKGEEITITYLGDEEGEERKNTLRKHGEFLIKEEEAEIRKYDTENELEMKVKMLKEKCNEGKKNSNLCDEILSTGNLHPHESLAKYYIRLSTQYLKKFDAKNGQIWFDFALSAFNRHAEYSFDSLSMNFLMENMKEAERLSDLMFGPNSWQQVKEILKEYY
jgi:hypothetical protein